MKGRGAGGSWWLPPVVWPEGEKALAKLVERAIASGARQFVLNAPWQITFFAKNKGADIWAGPFCNLSNPLAIAVAAEMGFSGAIVSPELGEKDYLTLPGQSPLQLGIVISGHWPLCVARAVADPVKEEVALVSPKGETAWAKRYGADNWIYPNWTLDLTRKKDLLKKAGYRLFIHLTEPVPRGVKIKKRQGLWNWDLGLR